MDSYKKLLNNSIVFAIGNLGSKIISIVLIPLYTYSLTTAQFGTIDLLITTSNLLIPIISANIGEATLRFILLKDFSNKKILSNAIFFLLLSSTIFLLILPIVNFYLKYEINLLVYFSLIVIIQMFQQVLSQYTKAIENIKLYSFNGILLTFLFGTLNVLFVVTFKMGLDGYFLSFIISYLLSIVFLSIQLKVWKLISYKYIEIKNIKLMLHYSLPLILNTIMWWVINASNRYFINIYLGMQDNGLYALAIKLPTLITIFTQVFSQAWQLSAIEEYGNDNTLFYSKVFKYYSSALLVLVSSVILVLKPMFNILFASDYFLAWKAVPFLLLGSAFSALSGFLGQTYVASMKTSGVFKTSVFGGGVSIVSNLLLISKFGIFGASLANFLSFFTMFYLRSKDAKKIINFNFNNRLFYVTLILILFQVLVLFQVNSFKLSIIFNLFLYFLVLIFNFDIFKICLTYAVKFINRVR